MQRQLRLGELVRANIQPDTGHKVTSVILEINGGNIKIAIPNKTVKYTIRTVNDQYVEPLTEDMVSEDEYNEAKKFQSEMDKEVDLTGRKVKGRTNGGRKKSNKKRKSNSRSKKRKSKRVYRK